MKVLLVTALVALLLCGFATAVYEQLPAESKQKFLWQKIQGDDNHPGSWPSTLQQLGLFTENLWITGEHVSDFFPEGRKKLIHSVGAIAMIKFAWNDAASRYTGLFQKADYGFLRASSATAPGYTGFFHKTKFLAPGISIKFLRDNVPSANFVSMWQLDGQQDFNFFLNPLCNHVADRPDLGFKYKLLGAKFKTVSQFPGLIGLSDFASYRQDGTREVQPNFPFALVFQPNPQVTSLFQNTDEYDLPSLFPRSFKGNEVLYKVFAIDNPNDDTNPIHIGYLQLASPFLASEFADAGLFFKHQFIEEDFVMRPEWKEIVSDPSRKLWEIEGAARYAPHLPAY